MNFGSPFFTNVSHKHTISGFLEYIYNLIYGSLFSRLLQLNWVTLSLFSVLFCLFNDLASDNEVVNAMIVFYG